jgi:polysaccharide biosynthesis transport protein
MARANMDVILIDADLRRAPVATRLGADGHYGLDAVLRGEKGIEEALEEVGAGGGRLRIVSGGSPAPDPSVLLGSSRMKSILAEMTEQADVVLIDTPSAMVVSDVIPLLAQASGVVLVARLDHTSRDDLVRAARVVDSARGRTLGVVATGGRAPAAYGYVYEESDGDRATEGRDRAPARPGKPLAEPARGLRRLISRSGRDAV